MHRNGVIVGRAAAYLAVFLVFATLNAVVATTWIRPDLAAVVGTLVWAVPIIVLYVAGPWSSVNARVVWLMAAWVVNALLMAMMTMGFWALVLHERGEQVRATVAEIHGSSDKDTTTYTLSHNGRLIPGRLTTWPGNDAVLTEGARGEPGERLTVIRDPEGLVDPRLPEEVTEAVDTVPVMIPFTIAVMAGLCVGAARYGVRAAA
ncbi:hypothetical protein [Actinoplanes utahensis]|uniref:DUF3592 domain-containing protein n=1 Tax=Actinoplanes utahensis TaxID=1869 RepID=A0A0A6X8I4_ACTUT|nr:hypothetical protein [Actinoplanes utahensis]KHD76447.1 hypothetical protein MB27_17225 [Actinoplanes utahensis]